MNLYAQFEKYTYSTREPNDDDAWDNGETSSDWTFPHVCYMDNYPDIKPNESFYIHETDIKPGDKIYLLSAIWGTGDSFGHDSACYVTHIYASKNKLKTQLAHELLDRNFLYFPDNQVLPSIPWDGYFDSLEYLTIIELTVDK